MQDWASMANSRLANVILILFTGNSLLPQPRDCQAQRMLTTVFEQVPELDNLCTSVNSTLEFTLNTTHLHCLRSCQRRDWCTSVCYNKNDGVCRLVTGTFGSSASDTIQQSGYSVWKGKFTAPSKTVFALFDVVIHLVRNVTGGVSNDTAMETCQKKGGELINLDSVDKYLGLKNFLHTTGIQQETGDIRVGGYRLANSMSYKDFILPNGRPFPFRSNWDCWQPGQPNNLYGRQFCLALKASSLHLQDVNCTQYPLGENFICEIPLSY